jgi:hypothetical protein
VLLEHRAVRAIVAFFAHRPSNVIESVFQTGNCSCG